MTDTHELFTVAGTTYTFRALPTDDDVTEDERSKIISERAVILAKAGKVKAPRKWAPPKPSKAPKPGDGTFTPKPDGRGATVTVSVLVYERRETGPFYVITTVDHEGMIVDLAPRGDRWVSLWDGRMPVGCRIMDGRGDVYMEVSEYERRFGELAAQVAQTTEEKVQTMA